MNKQPRLFLESLKILKAFCDNPVTPFYGAEFRLKLELSNGTVYPILRRFEKAGWLISYLEDIDPKKEKRPKRKYYKLTVLGLEKAKEALNAVA